MEVGMIRQKPEMLNVHAMSRQQGSRTNFSRTVTEDQLSVTIAVKQDIMHAIAHNKEKPMHKQFEEPHQDPRAKDV